MNDTIQYLFQSTSADHPTVVRHRAMGDHYSAKTVPHTLGTDGVGEIVSGPNSGKKAYFNALGINKSFQDVVNVLASDVSLLADGVNPVQIAALSNPAMSSWMAIRRRTIQLPKPFTALIIGVTSASGRVATALLRHHGAKKIIGLARNENAMKSLGLDATIVLREPAEQTDFGDMSGIDVILDYLDGPVALAALTALPGGTGQRTQYLQIGSLAADSFELPAHLLRSKDLWLGGSGIGSWTQKDMQEEMPEMMKAMPMVPREDLRVARLKDVTQVWGEKERRRIVFVTDNYEGSV